MMKTFVVKVLLFIAIIAFIDVLWGKVMNTALATTEKGDWGRRNYIINKTHEDILIFGSSRAIHHYDPQIFTDSLGMSCYNCAEDGSGILLHYPRLNALLQRYTPKIIIYDIMPKYDFLEFGENSALGPLRPYLSIQPIRNYVKDVDKLDVLKSYISLYKYNSSFIEIIQQRLSLSTSTVDEFTYSPLYGEINYLSDESCELEGNGLDQIKFEYLVDLIRLCQSNGIKLFFTASPWYKMRRSDKYTPIYELCRMKGVPFLNHNFDDDLNSRYVLFHDAAHLNKKGAETFSSIISHEIKLLELE